MKCDHSLSVCKMIFPIMVCIFSFIYFTISWFCRMGKGILFLFRICTLLAVRRGCYKSVKMVLLQIYLILTFYYG